MEKLHPLKVIGIMLILFGLPAISWYFMKSGADLRKSAIEEMGSFGSLPEFDLLRLDGDTLSLNDVKDKVLISNFLPKTILDREQTVEQLQWIQNQFKDRLLKREDFMFLTHVVADSLADLKQIEAKLNSEEFKRWNIGGASKETIENLAIEGYHLPLKNGETVFDNPYLAIVDTESEVRFFYDLFEKEDVAKLMIHLSLLLPQVDDRKVDIKTTAEN